MAGRICKIKEGKYKDKIASVNNKQDPEFIKAGKVQAFIFESIGKPLLDDGRHVNTLISPSKLQVTGFYD